MGTIIAIQDSALGAWMRESAWGIFTALIVHTICMGFVVGVGLAVGARMLGFARAIPLAALDGLVSFMGLAFLVAIVSGVFLVIGYPAKALLNPLFYVKLAMVFTAAAITWTIRRRVIAAAPAPPPSWATAAAVATMSLWAAALIAGKFLEYTFKTVLVR